MLARGWVLNTDGISHGPAVAQLPTPSHIVSPSSKQARGIASYEPLRRRHQPAGLPVDLRRLQACRLTQKDLVSLDVRILTTHSSPDTRPEQDICKTCCRTRIISSINQIAVLYFCMYASMGVIRCLDEARVARS